MNTILTNLDLLTSPFYKWSKRSETEFFVSTGMNIHTLRDYVVPVELLAKRHPELPRALTALFAHKREKTNAWLVFNNEVFATLDLLEKPLIAFNDDRGNALVMCDVAAFREDKKSKSKMYLHGKVLSVVTYEVNGQQVEFATRNEREGVTVSRKELDARYPGWAERREVCKALGYSDLELITQVFADDPTVNIAPLPESVKFD